MQTMVLLFVETMALCAKFKNKDVSTTPVMDFTRLLVVSNTGHTGKKISGKRFPDSVFSR